MSLTASQLDRIERKLDDLLEYFSIGTPTPMTRAQIKDFVAASLLRREEKRRKKHDHERNTG